jgi:predicted phosphodiesterase
MYKHWTEEENKLLLKYKRAGRSYPEIARELKHAGYTRTTTALTRHYERMVNNGLVLQVPDAVTDSPRDKLQDDIVAATKHKSLSYEELSDKLDTSMGKVRAAVVALADKGHNIVVTDNERVSMSAQPALGSEYRIDIYKQTNGVYRFGAIGDSHMGSKYERLDILEALYDEFERQEIDTVYHCGNWIDGEFKFNKHDLHTAGMDGQLKYFVENYPRREGIKTQYISGDCHEGWYGQREGLNIGKHLQHEAAEHGREDLEYLGHLEADIVYEAPEGSTTIRLVHPGGGSAYALSYSVQKIVESYQGGEKPQVLLCGHYHKAEYSYIRGVHCVQVGCTQDQTPFMRKKKLQAHLGGWIIELGVGKQGAVTWFKQQFFPFYDREYHQKWAYQW